MDVFDSKEMRWASCCGVSFCGCNARLCEVSALFSKKKIPPENLGGGDCGRDGGSRDSGANGEGFRAALASTSVKVLQNDSARRRKAAARRAPIGRH